VNYRVLVLRLSQYIDPRNRPRIVIAALLQASLAVLDIIGIALFGVLTYTITTGKSPKYFDNQNLLKGLSIEQISTMILFLAVIFFCLKGVLAPLFFNFTSRIVSGNASKFSSSLTKYFFSKSLKFVEKDSALENLYTVGTAALGIINIGIGSVLILCSELSLLVLIIVMLTIVNPYLSFVTVAYFCVILFFLQRIIAKKLADQHGKSVQANLSAARVYMDIFNNFREIRTNQKFQLFDTEYEAFRKIESQASMKILLLNIIPKYIFEVLFFLGAGIIFAFLVKTQNQQEAIVQLTIFIAGGSRILPSILRVQSALSGLNSVEIFMKRVELLQDSQSNVNSQVRVIRTGDEVNSNNVVEIKELSFQYSINSSWKLRIPELTVTRGERVAIVGESGSGKSTLVDIILGMQDFSSGSVAINVGSHEKISYVPQKLSLMNRSILENVALGVPIDSIDTLLVEESLNKAGMLDFVATLPQGLETQVGERGVYLSGGQMQRIAISRAFYVSPELLILDEATSALDSTSEDAITTVLNSLPDEVTSVIIAHRLSTVQSADRVIYMKSGEIHGQGKFDEVRRLIPDFDRQAKLMGL